MRGSRPKRTVARARRACFAALAALVILGASVLPCGASGFPRVANIYFPCLAGADQQELVRLARYDLLVVVAANSDWAPGELATLRALNPEITLLPHTPFSYHGDWEAPPLLGDLRDSLDAYNWWLRDTAGQRYYLPEGTLLINVTTNCPTNPRGQRFCDWYGEYLGARLAPGGPWDGIFLDLCIDQISWVIGATGVSIDSDLDGAPDDPDELNEVWREGTAIAVSRLRELVGGDYVLVTNGGNTLWDDVNGTTFEGFPELPNGWYENITDPDRGYITADTHYREPRFNIINPNWYQPAGDDGPVWSGYFIKKFLFTMASTLVFGDAYYSMNSRSYCETWWFPYYDLDIGEPLGPAEDAVAYPGDVPGVEYGDMIKIRRFSHGVATVNPTNIMQEVILPGEYYDPEEYNGHFLPLSSTLTAVVMNSKMGRVLVGSGVVRPETVTIAQAVYDADAVEVEWSGPPWAARYALYRSGVRGDGSLGGPELVLVTDETTYRDTHIVRGRCYAYSVSAIDDLDCEGRPSEPVVMSTAPTVNPSVALMVEEPDGLIILTWSPPVVPDDLIFELERTDGKGTREWLGRFPAGDGRAVRYVDRSAVSGRVYRYELFEVSGSDRRLVAAVRVRVPLRESASTAHLGCWPQPADRGSATIAFRVGDDDNWEDDPHVALTVYDVRGRLVRRVLDRTLARGDHSVVWDCRNGAGMTVASGCYPYTLDIGGRRFVGKVLVIR